MKSHWTATLGLTLMLSASAKADSAAPAPPTKSAVYVVYAPGAVKDLNDLRLTEIESELGILHWVWEMEIPAGKKLIVRFTSKDSTGEGYSHENIVMDVTGPVSRSFNHRIGMTSNLSGVHRPTSGPPATYTLEVTTGESGATPQGTFPAEILTMAGDRGSTPGDTTSLPCTIWEMHFGPDVTSKMIDYKIVLNEVSAGSDDKPGSVVMEGLNRPKQD